MRQEYVVEPTSDGRLQLRLVLVPENPYEDLPQEEPESGVIIISPNYDHDQSSSHVIILEM